MDIKTLLEMFRSVLNNERNEEDNFEVLNILNDVYEDYGLKKIEKVHVYWTVTSALGSPLRAFGLGRDRYHLYNFKEVIFETMLEADAYILGLVEEPVADHAQLIFETSWDAYVKTLLNIGRISEEDAELAIEIGSDKSKKIFKDKTNI